MLLTVATASLAWKAVVGVCTVSCPSLFEGVQATATSTVALPKKQGSTGKRIASLL